MLDPFDEELEEPDELDDPDEEESEEDPFEDPEDDEDSALPAFTVLVVDVLRESVR